MAPSGDDTGPGTADQPFRTIQRGLDAAGQPGDTVTVRAGTYAEHLTLRSAGTRRGFVTLQAAAGERPVLDGTGLPGGHMIFLQNISYVRIVGFELAHNHGVLDGSAIRIEGSGSHIEIRNNVIHDLRGQSAMGITVYGTAARPMSRIIIDGNQVYDAEPAPSEAIVLNGNVRNFQITNNTVHDVNNIGIDLIGGERDIHPTQGARLGVVRGNVVFNARSTYEDGFAAGIYVDGGADIVIENNVSHHNDIGMEIGAENRGAVAHSITVRNNLIYENDKAGLAFGGFDRSAGRVQASTFVNNTVYGNDTRGVGFGQLWIQYASNNVVASNIFYANAHQMLLASDAGNSRNKLNHNVWYAAGDAGSARFTWNGVEYATFDAYRAGTGQDRRSVLADPRFVDAAAGDFHVRTGSPAIDVASPSPSQFAPTDFAGRRRPAGPRADAGAFEGFVDT